MVQHAAVLRNMVLTSHPSDMRWGLFSAYYRSMAPARTAKTLVQQGGIVRDPLKRSYDTALLIMEVMVAGFDDARGQEALRVIVAAHRHIPGSVQDYWYIALSLAIEPMRWIEQYGRSPLTDTERSALYWFAEELSFHMGKALQFTDLQAALAFYNQYEEEIDSSAEAPRLFDSALGAFRLELPRVVRPLDRAIVATVIGNDRVSRALGVSATALRLQPFIKVALFLRKHAPFWPESTFRPGITGKAVYPEGYRISDLGRET